MERMIFVNLPVRDLTRSIAFYRAIGGVQNMDFSDDSAAMMRFSETISVMLLTHARFSSFTARQIPDATQTAQMLLALSQESRDAVDAAVASAAATGGTADPNPSQDHGFMYGRSFADPDGHIWEPVWMDMAAAMAGQAAAD
ncbi:MAG TPA: VOC family protein [Sphingobium sp.]|nr:VOC family protein [Sphingobium sp.]